MKKENVPSLAKTGLLFYSNVERPMAVDYVAINDKGAFVGFYSRKTRQELAQESGTPIFVAGVKTFEDMQQVHHTTQPTEISETDYISALEALPPMRWGRWHRVESFRSSEFYCGNVTRIYAATPDGRYWTFRDNAYMEGEDIALKVLAKAAELPSVLH